MALSDAGIARSATPYRPAARGMDGGRACQAATFAGSELDRDGRWSSAKMPAISTWPFVAFTINFALPSLGQRSRRRHEAAVRSSTWKSVAAAASPTCWMYSDSVMAVPVLHVLCCSGKSELHTSRVPPRNLHAHPSRMNSSMRKRDYRREVGRRLKAARLEAKAGTQAEVASKLSAALGETIEPSAIGNYEQGTRLPDPITMQSLCALYGASPSAVYGFNDAPQSRDEELLLQKYRMTDDRGRRAIQSIAESQPAYMRPDQPRKAV